MNVYNYIVSWVSAVPWWQTVITYFFGAIFFGTLNKRLQRWRCMKATDCRKWDGDLSCSHGFSSIFGYPLWPFMLPMTILYTIAESKLFAWDKPLVRRDR
jgi:hypothetical protein